MIPDAVVSTPAELRPRVVLPCAESCLAYRPLKADSWSDFGVCTNPRSPYCGYPVRPGRDCRNHVVPAQTVTSAG
jgi:hypothetical protein